MLALPTLYHQSRSGAVHSWEVRVEGDTIISTTGTLEGKKLTHRRVATPKNVGRANATTAEQQAEIEAQAMHKKQLEGHYCLTIEQAQQPVLAHMLAESFEDYSNSVVYPVHIQPKLDGVRAFASWEGAEVVLTSRGGKRYTATPHICRQLEQLLPHGTVFDGELYLHGQRIQWISGHARAAQDGSELLEFHVYDAPMIKDEYAFTWAARFNYLVNIIGQAVPPYTPHIKYVPTLTAESAAWVQRQHDYFVAEGYEGAIVRPFSGVYEFGYRSRYLLKVKRFQDTEFPVVGHKEGVGNETSLVIWTCEVPGTGRTFEVRPRGTHEERRELFTIAATKYSKLLKVRHFGYTADGIPWHPTGLGFRLEEDL